MIDYALRLDQSIFWIINAHHNRMFDILFSSITQFGNGWLAIPAVFAFVIWRAPRAERWGVLMFFAISLGITGFLCVQIKGVVRRQRPHAYFSQRSDVSLPNASVNEKSKSDTPTVHTVGRIFHGHSFPSGHSMNAFALASILMVFFGRKWWPAFVAAFLVGYSRIYLGEHFPSDVLASAAIGPAVVWCIVLAFKKNRIQAEEKAD